MSGKVQIAFGSAVNLALEMLVQAQRISTLVQAAQLRGDATLDKEEYDAIIAARQSAFDRLDQEIAAADAKPSGESQSQQPGSPV